MKKIENILITFAFLFSLRFCQNTTTIQFSVLSKNINFYCNNIDISSVLAMSLNRTAYYNSSMNFFQMFANGTVTFFMSSNYASNVVKILVPLLIPILMMVGFIVMMVFVIGIFFPNFCKARKEEINLSKQRIFFFFTMFFIIGIFASFSFLWYYINQTITNVNISACLYYSAQYELTTGYTTAPYAFMGFDNFNSAVSIFQQELVNFGSLAPFFQQINGINFLNYITNISLSVQNYSNYYANSTIMDVDGTMQMPMLIQSLTPMINQNISSDVNLVVTLCQNLANLANYGISTISTYGQSMNVFIQSLTSTINVVVNQFQTILSVLEPYNIWIETIVQIMNSTQIIMVVLAILTFAFVPFFFSFYHFKNSSDKYDWLIYPAKVVNLLLGFLGIIFTCLFFIFLIMTLIVSGGCYYVNGILTNSTDFNQKYIKDLQLNNTNINSTLWYCFNQSTSNFMMFLNVSGNSNQINIPTSLTPIRKVPGNINHVAPILANTTNSTGTVSINLSIGSGMRLLKAIEYIQESTEGIMDGLESTSGRYLQTSTTPSTQNTTAANGSVYVLSNLTIPNPPPGFNLSALVNFQKFIGYLNNYDNFYMQSYSSTAPSISDFSSNISSVASGQTYNFINYVVVLQNINNFLMCNGSIAALSSEDCNSNPNCIVISSTPLAIFSQQLSLVDCISDKTTLVNLYSSLLASYQSSLSLYSQMQTNLTSTTQQSYYQTPGSLISNARSAIINASSIISNIEDYISSTMAWFNQFNGTLDGITSCYIAHKELKGVEPAFCFLLQTSMSYTTLYLFAISICVLLIQIGIFYSVKYSGNLSFASWASNTTQGSGWDKSKLTAVSFMQQSEIVINDKSDVDDSEDEKGYFGENNDVKER